LHLICADLPRASHALRRVTGALDERLAKLANGQRVVKFDLHHRIRLGRIQPSAKRL
jgi:hypothetical protein